MCYNRLENVRTTWESLALARGRESFRLEIYADGPRDAQDEPAVRGVRDFLLASLREAPFASVHLEAASTNLGVWENKLRAFRCAFDRGADLVLLLEDDVVLAPDFLFFLEDLYPFVVGQDRLVTLGLYSTNLQASASGVPFTQAQAFLDAHPEVHSAWGAREWPFPWGLALTREAFERFQTLGWTGNDQNLGNWLRHEGGVEVFPILTRAFHRGNVSSTSGQAVDLLEFFGPAAPVSVAQFPVGDGETLQSALDRGYQYWLGLKNDLGWTEFQVTLLGGADHDRERRKRFEASYPFLRIRVWEVDTHRDRDRVLEELGSLCHRVYTSIFVLDLGTEFNRYCAEVLRSLGVTKVTTDFDEPSILELLQRD